MHLFGYYLRRHSFVNLDGFLGGVTDHPAVRALGNVRLQLLTKFYIRGLVEKIVELLQELFTCKQKRRPLFA